MVLFFSGTGNSAYAARKIAEEIGDEAQSLFSKIGRRDFSEMHSEKPWVIVAPTYSWRIPRIIEKYLKKTPLSGNRRIYFVLTCGTDIGNAGKYLEKLCAAKKMQYMGCRAIVMPENYIVMFPIPNQDEARSILQNAKGTISETTRMIRENQPFPPAKITLMDRLKSGVVNDFFYPFCVHAKKFHTTDDCVFCGKCAALCPLNNIRMENGKPLWGKNCTHCMACISHCPKAAIEYGKSSIGKPRYTCPKDL